MIFKILKSKGLSNYRVYTDGRIFNINRGKFRNPGFRKRGYVTMIMINDRGNKEKWYLHRLVATAHIPNPLNLPEVNHKDFNKANNHKDNLEWSTRKQNQEHMSIGGRCNFDRPWLKRNRFARKVKSDKKIYNLKLKGMRAEDIAIKYNLSIKTVYNAINRYTYES